MENTISRVTRHEGGGMKPLRVGFPFWHRGWPLFMTAWFAFSAWLSWGIGGGSFNTFVYVAGMLFGPLAYLSNVQSVEMTDEFVRVKTPTFCYEMRWDEVEEIEAAPQPEGLKVLRGSGKKLLIPALLYAVGDDKTAMNQFLQAKIEAHGIPVKTVPFFRASFQLHKNTRVRQ